MLTNDQIKNITWIYDKFLQSENNGWEELDNYLELLDYLDDSELCTESEVLFISHKNKNMGCGFKHQNNSYCTVNYILEAVESILNLYKETKNLHVKNRYILCYYLALSQAGQIVEMND